jgi:hypothetical protein
MSKLILAAVFSFWFTGSSSNDDQLQIGRAIARHFHADARLDLVDVVDPSTAHFELAPEPLHVRPARAVIPAAADSNVELAVRSYP